MAKISLDDVDYVAKLAHLRLNDDARTAMQRDLASILEYMDKLGELDTTDVEPMMHVQDMTNVFREDIVAPSLDHEAAMAIAPSTDGVYFLVPPILDSE